MRRWELRPVRGRPDWAGEGRQPASANPMPAGPLLVPRWVAAVQRLAGNRAAVEMLTGVRVQRAEPASTVEPAPSVAAAGPGRAPTPQEKDVWDDPATARPRSCTRPAGPTSRSRP